jgi:hypothetical protein
MTAGFCPWGSIAYLPSQFGRNFDRLQFDGALPTKAGRFA